MSIVEISNIQLLLCLIFVLFTGISSIFLNLGLEKDISIGAIRTFIQLFIMAYVLRYIFKIDNAYLILLISLGMILFAAITIQGRVKERKISYFIPTFLSMVISYMIVTVVVTAVIVQVDPWYKPQYFILLGGMVVGKSMNAVAISLDRLFSEVRKRREEIEMYLCLGATYQEATMDILKNSIRAGMIPTINAMMAVGVIFVPGTMTGIILTGADPLLSIKYQIVVMLMLSAATAIGSIIVTYLVMRMCFTSEHQIKID